LSTDSYTCSGTAALPNHTSCSTLSVTYSLSLQPLSGTPWYVLAQNVSLAPHLPGCAPSSFFAAALPRSVTLAPMAARDGLTRRVATHLQSGAPFDFDVATSGEYNGVVFVSAGTFWKGVNKSVPAYPNFAMSVPLLDEYLEGAAAGTPRLTVTADPYFFTNFDVGYAAQQTQWGWAFACDNPNIGCFSDRSSEVRQFYTILATDNDTSLDARMQKFYATSLAHIPPAPQWTQAVRFTNYDYFSPLPPSPNGWDADVDALAPFVSAEDRGKVVFTLHGHYGLIGQYALADPSSSALMSNWTVFPDGENYINEVTGAPVGPINVTLDTIHARIAKAKQAGFRVIFYFADGLNTCEGVAEPFLSAQKILTTYKGGEWKGPDSLGKLSALNPLHPATWTQYSNYMQGILDEFGDTIDGFVWDETFELLHDQEGTQEARGYAARGLMELIQSLTTQVHAHPKCAGRCVFLVAGCLHEMPHALVSDGTWEDTGLNPASAPFGTLLNYRNVLWECAWLDVSRGYNERTQTTDVMVSYNIPSSVTNGWGDFRGFANMTLPMQQYFTGLMSNHTDDEGPRFPSGAR
jgi:hypothetical protein